MALAKVQSCAVAGLDGELVEVEVDIARGMPAFSIVGLPDAAVQEAKDRVRSAIQNSGFPFPRSRITVNLAPADLRKEGPAYDLPIPVAILIASQQSFGESEKTVFIGELSLDGEVRHAQGVLPMVGLAKERGIETVYVPQSDAQEAALIDDMRVVPVPTLKRLMEHLAGTEAIPDFHCNGTAPEQRELWEGTDFGEVRGQEHVTIPMNGSCLERA